MRLQYCIVCSVIDFQSFRKLILHFVNLKLDELSWIMFIIHKRFTERVEFFLLPIFYQIYEIQNRINFGNFTNNITEFHDEINDPHFSIVIVSLIIFVLTI